jgi:hypothetical protein
LVSVWAKAEKVNNPVKVNKINSLFFILRSLFRVFIF